MIVFFFLYLMTEYLTIIMLVINDYFYVWV